MSIHMDNLPARHWPQPILALFALSLTLVMPAGLRAGNPCCEQCGARSQGHHGHLVTRTIMVPTWVTETRMESKVIKKTVEREEKYTVFQVVPVTRKFTKECCYLEDDVKTQMITEKKCHLVQNSAEITKHVQVPETELRTETVCREICNPDGTVSVVEEPCTREVTVLRDDIETYTCKRPQLVFEETKREITYCVKVPKKREIPCSEEKVCELQPVEKTRMVTVCVPEVIKQPVEVTVCKMVPKTIVCCQKCAKKH